MLKTGYRGISLHRSRCQGTAHGSRIFLPQNHEDNGNRIIGSSGRQVIGKPKAIKTSPLITQITLIDTDQIWRSSAWISDEVFAVAYGLLPEACDLSFPSQVFQPGLLVGA